jgi:ribosomal protein S27E
MSRNVVFREQVRAGVVECPLCSRQIATPEDHLLVYSSVERVDAENADAIECPSCAGVTFVVDASDTPE